MGAIQDGVLNHGGKAIGVMPKMLDEHEITSQRLTELILVDSIHKLLKIKWQNLQMHLSSALVAQVTRRIFRNV